MAISLKPQHLSRYRQVVRLLFKYGRKDVLRESGLEDPAPGPLTAASASIIGAVHQLPGEILRVMHEQEAKREAEHGTPAANGHRAAAEPEPIDPASQLADDLEALGPTFIKVGQFLSTRADLLPPSYLEALARLQDNVAPFSYTEVEQVISDQLGVRISKAFASFERTPVAAASLGQVHRAELRSGLVVAVKVQRPDMRERVTEDLNVLNEIAQLLDKHTNVGKRNGFQDMLEEFRTSLNRELDYRQEARHLSVLGANLADFDRIVVPSPVDDYVTERVLTMEFVHGRKVTALGPLARLEVDGELLAEQLCRAYLQQILVDGFFHADPHPGNIFLTNDERIAFIDLGMVAQMSPGMQEQMLKLVLAISEGRGEDAGQIVVRLGTPFGPTDATHVRRKIADRVMEFQGLKIREIALGRMLFDVSRIAGDGGFRLPRELTLLSKTLLNVDEVARRLDPEFDPNASIRRNAAEIMRGRMLKSFSPGKMFDGLLEMKDLFEKLPRRLNQLIDAVTENRLKIRVDAINEALLMEGLQKIANRITVGLVISAMIVGAAMMMRIETSFRILGYPGVAILLFLAAALGAGVMVFNILMHDVRAEKRKVLRQQEQLKRDVS